MAKKTRGYFENLFEYYFLNIVGNVNSFSDLNITVSTTLKYYHQQALSKKLKLMGGAMKYFSEKLLGNETFSSMVPLDANFFFETFVKSSGPPPRYLMCAP